MPNTDILEEAYQLTAGERNKDYGHPYDDFSRTAEMWNAMFADRITEPFKASDVARAMICIKLSRSVHAPKRDNWVDIAGYARCGGMCEGDFEATEQ